MTPAEMRIRRSSVLPLSGNCAMVEASRTLPSGRRFRVDDGRGGIYFYGLRNGSGLQHHVDARVRVASKRTPFTVLGLKPVSSTLTL